MRSLRLGLFSFLLLALWATSLQAQKEFGFDNRKGSGQPYLKPEETVDRMKIADGFEAKLYAAEPQLVNPIAMTVDEKGRVWVVECFEYPKRTPKGKMPRDRIKILEDTDGDGICDKTTIFAEGKDFPKPFDLASGIEVGYGGVFLGAPPYLWFLRDTNGDGKADKFEILLKGFGSEDTHETLNTFQWGPDGKLYGLHGVFTHSEVKPEQADGPGTRINAAVWRYDVRNRRFETFAEGTSNPWGMDYRNSDGQFILCCCVIPHLFHMSPGGIYKRQAGNSFNNYAYSYLNEICDHTFHKESGWAHAGLISLDTPMMPKEYRNSVIFGSIHGCAIKQNILKPNGSTYIASRQDNFLTSGDKNFRPINLRWGPNGEIFCIDWHDQNPCHQTAPDDWDYERGRVYRLQTKGLKTQKAEDLGKKTDQDLFNILMTDENPYRWRTALRIFAERSTKVDPKVINSLDHLVGLGAADNDVRLRALWARQVVGGLQEHRYTDDGFLESRPDEMKGWTIRYMAESDSHFLKQDDLWKKENARKLEQFVDMAKNTKSPTIRRELASFSVRVSKTHEINNLIKALMQRKEDAKDPVIPQLLWLAYESRLVASIKDDLEWLKENAPGNALITETIVPRTMRRLVATGKAEDLELCVAFLKNVKDSSVQRSALEGLVSALQNRQVDAPAAWKELRTELAKSESKAIVDLANKLAVNFRDREAIAKAMTIFPDVSKSLQERIEAIRAIALGRPPEALDPLKKVALSTESPHELRTEAIRALGGYEGVGLAKELLADWNKYSPAIQNEVISLLAGRKEWARELLNAIGANKVQRTSLTDNTILRIQGFNDQQLNRLIEKSWGRVRQSPAELSQLIDRMRGELNRGRASFERGKIVFENQCAKCHKFDGKGHEVGPNIEGAGRDVEYLLNNVLDPNRVIGSPYFMRTVILDNGRSEAGVLVAEDDQTITLKMENAVQKVISKKEIEKVRIQEKSLMPEGLANNMSVQDFRDLVRYVMANPFLTDVIVSVKDGANSSVVMSIIPPSGRIVLPNSEKDVSIEIQTEVTATEDMKTKLLLGNRSFSEVIINGKSREVRGSGKKAEPDQIALDVELKKGINTIKIRTRHKGNDEAIFARFVDPDRKLIYHDLVKRK